MAEVAGAEGSRVVFRRGLVHRVLLRRSRTSLQEQEQEQEQEVGGDVRCKEEGGEVEEEKPAEVVVSPKQDSSRSDGLMQMDMDASDAGSEMHGGVDVEDEDLLEFLMQVTVLPELERKPPRQLLQLIKVAESVSNFDDMRYCARELCRKRNKLSEAERLSVANAYKNAISLRRTSWKKICDLKEDEAQLQREIDGSTADEGNIDEGNIDEGLVDAEAQGELSQSLSSRNGIPMSRRSDITDDESIDSPVTLVSEVVRAELEEIAQEFIAILQNLLEHEEDKKVLVFYSKLVGDYYRYMSENVSSDRNQAFIKQAEEAYDEARELAKFCLEPHDQDYLKLMLNVAVFYYEILNRPDQACNLAKESHDSAVKLLEGQDPSTAREGSNQQLDLLRDNLKSWTQDEQL